MHENAPPGNYRCMRTTGSITAYPDGPLVVRGDITVLDSKGQPLPRRAAVVAVCRCGLSSRAPWCDGSHKVAARRPEKNTDQTQGE